MKIVHLLAPRSPATVGVGSLDVARASVVSEMRREAEDGLIRELKLNLGERGGGLVKKKINSLL